MKLPITYSIDPALFVSEVKSWIDSCVYEQLDHLAKFVNDSPYRPNTKRELLTYIEQAETILQGEPLFIDGELCDKHRNPKIYTTRFSAYMKYWMLRMLDYHVELQPTGTFYRVRLSVVVPVENFETVNVN